MSARRLLDHVLRNLKIVMADYKIAASFVIGGLLVLVVTAYSGSLAERVRHADEYKYQLSARAMSCAVDALSDKHFKRAEKFGREAVCLDPMNVQYHLTLARIYVLNHKILLAQLEEQIVHRLKTERFNI
jgi:Tfp pilus assembly protein PilF